DDADARFVTPIHACATPGGLPGATGSSSELGRRAAHQIGGAADHGSASTPSSPLRMPLCRPIAPATFLRTRPLILLAAPSGGVLGCEEWQHSKLPLRARERRPRRWSGSSSARCG